MDIRKFFGNTVIFDWDGTLIDSFDACFGAFHSSLKAYGVDLEENYFRKMYTLGWKNIYQHLKIPQYKWNDVNRYWFEHYHIDLIKCIPAEVEITLQNMKNDGLRTGIITNGSQMRVEKELKASGLYKFFSFVIYGDSTIYSKPNPSLMAHLLSQINVKRNEVIYIGDTYSDVVFGKRAGVFTVLKISKYTFRKNYSLYKPDLIIHNLRECRQLF